MKTGVRVFAAGLMVMFSVFFTITQTTAPYEISALAQGKRTTTKVASNRYGEGGTLETTSDEKLRLLAEVWRDKNGKIKEVHEFSSPNGETWLFSSSGKGFDFRLEMDLDAEGKTWNLTRNFPNKGPILTNVSKEEIDDAVAEIEKQFAKDGTLPKKPKQETGEDASAKQLTLPPNEVFTRPKDEAPITDPCIGVTLAKVPAPQATARIKCYIAHIEERRKHMIDTYFDTGAKKTLEAAFKANGVTASMTYAEAWGEGGIGLTWSESAKQFYDNHLDALDQARKIVQQRGYATRSEMISLSDGILQWDRSDRNIEFYFKVMVETYTDRAKVNDEKVAEDDKFKLALARAAAVTPYNASAVDALYAKHAETLKPMDAKIKLIDERESRTKVNITSLATVYIGNFSVFKKTP